MTKLFYVVAKYRSKYGLIVYCIPVQSVADPIDLDNCYINTFYFKGKDEIKTNECYEFSTIKGENGLTYCFL